MGLPASTCREKIVECQQVEEWDDFPSVALDDDGNLKLKHDDRSPRKSLRKGFASNRCDYYGIGTHKIKDELLTDLQFTGIKSDSAAIVSPLEIAAKNNDYCMVRALVEAHGDLEQRDSSGRTALLHAIESGHVEMTGLLLSLKASIETATGQDTSGALLSAARVGNEAMVKMLLHAQAKVMPAGQNGTSALHLAASFDHVKIVELFLQTRADVEAADGKLKYTPLICASRGDAISVAKVLIENRASLHAQDSLGRTPLSAAAEVGAVRAVRLLLDQRAQLRIDDVKASNTLQLALSGKKGYSSDILLDSIEEHSCSLRATTEPSDKGFVKQFCGAQSSTELPSLWDLLRDVGDEEVASESDTLTRQSAGDARSFQRTSESFVTQFI